MIPPKPIHTNIATAWRAGDELRDGRCRIASRVRGLAASLGYVAAATICASAARHQDEADAFGERFTRTRSQQQNWLSDRLGLAPPSPSSTTAPADPLRLRSP